jgi:hypothetical protein
LDWFKSCVGKSGINANYFWDEMSMVEINAVIQGLNEDYQNDWDKVRILRNTIGRCLGVKLQPLKFSWDTEDPKEVLLTPEDLVKIQYELINSVKNKI